MILFGIVIWAAPVEWIEESASLESALEIADVVDSATLQYELEMDKFIYVHEALNEMKRLERMLTLPEYEILLVRQQNRAVSCALAVLVKEVPSYFEEGDLLEGAESLPETVPSGTARECVERASQLKQQRPHALQERVDGYKDAFIRDLITFGSGKKKSVEPRDVLEWMVNIRRRGGEAMLATPKRPGKRS